MEAWNYADFLTMCTLSMEDDGDSDSEANISPRQAAGISVGAFVIAIGGATLMYKTVGQRMAEDNAMTTAKELQQEDPDAQLLILRVELRNDCR